MTVDVVICEFNHDENVYVAAIMLMIWSSETDIGVIHIKLRLNMLNIPYL